MMKNYIGTKIIQAEPMTRKEYNELRGWGVPENENPNDEGYLVVYPNSPDRNMAGYDGYVSWSPKAEFEKAYHDFAGGMTFGQAVELLKRGKRVARTGWNGKGMFVIYSGNNDLFVKEKLPDGVMDTDMKVKPQFYLKTVDNAFQSWVASISDTLAEDWYVVV